jgi:hypothetical protein
MLKYVYFLAIVAQLVYAQDDDADATIYQENEVAEDDRAEIVTQWTNDLGYNATVNGYCTQNCIHECEKPCTKAVLCTEDQIECGKKDLPPGEWPECIHDDICVPDGCDCQTPGTDGSLCPLWCETQCAETQIKCPGGTDGNNCKELDTCIDRPIGNEGQLCPGYCPVDCNVVTEHTCSTPPDNGCPQAPTCNTKATDNKGDYCDYQKCQKTCETGHKFCAGEQQVDGCYEADICVPNDISDTLAVCDGNCPIKCDPWEEIKCDGTTIHHGPTSGCKNADSCVQNARDVNGEFCPASSASNDCPITCDDDEHPCPPQTEANGCKGQAGCTKCPKDKDGKCCSQASVCPCTCKSHEKCCIPPGDDNGCPKVPICVVQERDYYGDLCTVHCPGVCNENQIMCPGKRGPTGCPMPPTCQPIQKKQWGDSKGESCPGFCPADCQDWEIVCAAVQDPCDGCPTEPVCKPQAKNINGQYCPSESASHGCDISCKTLDGESTICPAYEDATNPGCKERLVCLPRSTDNQDPPKLCPEHSVCPKKCAANEKKCATGFDKNDCKNEDVCILVPNDGNGHACLDFECPPSCNEEEQRYCQGEYKYNQNGQLCPLVDYCVDRPFDSNDPPVRCPGHCQPECGAGYEVKQQTGVDARGCPLAAVCHEIVAE